jgi:RHS repeat-associated protein
LPSTLTNTTDSVTVVSGVSYGVAGEMTTFVSGGGTETRSYNVNGQLTTLNLPGRTVTYNFPAAGSNNGKVSSVVDSGETISYLYDSLQRLTSATGSGWSQTFSYDGFGNMTGKVGTGGAPSWSGAIDPATNRLSGVSFDANGNQLALPMTSGMPDVFTATYDASNRMIYVENPTQSRRTWYEYDAGNKRVYEKRVDGSTQEWFHYFGITGQRLARYSFTVSGAVITFAEHENSVWFGGKLVRNAGSWTNEDRLGSVGKYLPYGEDKPGSTNPASDSVKFATYTRDAGTGIDYADQRWHAQGVGRFLTSDPYQASAGAEDPGSWNRYGYVGGDPVGNLDSTGEKKCNPDEQNTCVDVEGSTTVLSYIWRTSLPTVVPTLDPNLQGRLYAAPYQRARKWQAVALNPAAENHVNDCQALANFAEDVAWDMIAQGNTSFESFIQAFGSFVPAGNGMVAAANSLGFNISAAANPASWTPLNNGNVPSGFARAYQDSQNGNPNNNDQSHHFAAFLQFGYQAADLLGAGDLSATLYDLFHNNFGDIALGIVAADLGRALRLSERSLASGLPPSGGLMTPLMMASEIRKLCK